MGSTVDLVEVDAQHEVTRDRKARVRPSIQKAGTAISFAAGTIAFCGYAFALIAGDLASDGSPRTFDWRTFAFVVLPLAGSLGSLAQRTSVRNASTPIVVAAAAELIFVAVRFLRTTPDSTVTMAVVAGVLLFGGLGLLAHVGTNAAQDRDVQLYVGLFAAWTMFTGSLGVFIFGHTAILTPLVLCAAAVVLLHIHNDDPTALRRRMVRQQPKPTNVGADAQRMG